MNKIIAVCIMAIGAHEVAYVVGSTGPEAADNRVIGKIEELPGKHFPTWNLYEENGDPIATISSGMHPFHTSYADPRPQPVLLMFKGDTKKYDLKKGKFYRCVPMTGSLEFMEVTKSDNEIVQVPTEQFDNIPLADTHYIDVMCNTEEHKNLTKDNIYEVQITGEGKKAFVVNDKGDKELVPANFFTI